MNAFAKFLKEQRERRALTQVEMAELLGVSSLWYSRIELGKRKPGVTFIKSVSKLTRTSTRRLYDYLNTEEE